eukprot:TRINITY_DN41246_c0_g1_i1.p1 TRINITY_DN41246_c0_g1~~TRINITY_DN41246_c0_g1_i1.p1  ORF type:complete len:208 (+),score=27.97 TRINITY_DN41246_c0_g1_i1:47-670(+)
MSRSSGCTFRVECETQLGETVAVVGSIPALGCWKVGQAIRLRTDAGSYPLWTSPELPSGLFPEDDSFQYKFLVLNADGNVKKWESFSGNRTKTKGQQLDVHVFGCPAGDGKTFSLARDGQDLYWLVLCPHEGCSQWFRVDASDVNCTIFRHGVYKDTGRMLPPHARQQECEDAISRGALYGCGKPVRFNPWNWDSERPVVCKGCYSD